MHKKSILLTGCCGFIGFHVAKRLLENNQLVIGIDNLNSYYDVALKQARLEILKKFDNFIFYRLDLREHSLIKDLAIRHPDVSFIVHLAAQAGVRYSLIDPFAYIDSNVTGQLAMLELARSLKKIEHLVYASSSSVYGSNINLPFSVKDRTDNPISLYAATKKSCELINHCYSHLFGIKSTGLRFFTVYGPWGRPDMSAFIFTKAILNGDKIPVYNFGDMRRNFTYIDDIVSGTISCLFSEKVINSKNLFNIYNLGNSRSENLMDFINTLEKHIRIKAKIDFLPMQPGDVKETIADLTESTKDFGFIPKTNIDEGLKNFIDWYKIYFKVDNKVYS